MMTHNPFSPTLARATMPRGIAASQRIGPVLAAVGAPDAATTVRVAAAIAERLAREMTILCVIDAPPGGARNADDARVDSILWEVQAAEAREEIGHIVELISSRAALPVEIVGGEVPRTIARVASERQAPLIVMGIGRHRPIDRLTGADTVLRTLRAADCPVLAVSRAMNTLPTSAAVGVDFSRASGSAAKAVAQLLPAGGTLHLVHVWQPLDVDDGVAAREDSHYRKHLPQRFRRFIAALSLPARLDVKCEVREGRPAERLTDFADAHRIDLIAVGRHGRNPLQRLLVGGVAERVLRNANRSVLIAPEPTFSELTSSELSDEWSEHFAKRSEWTSRLDDFARRNAGQLVCLAVDDPEHGVTSRERGYILFGTSFDQAVDVIRIVLGEKNGRREHLTRLVRGATGLSIVRDVTGADMALRIAHGRSETLLSIAPRPVSSSPA